VKPLDDKDHIDVYMTAVKRSEKTNKWPKTGWDSGLGTALTGKTREAFTRMPVRELED